MGVGVGVSGDLAVSFPADLAALVAGSGAAGKINDPMAERFSGGRARLRSRCRDACSMQNVINIIIARMLCVAYKYFY